MSAILSDSVAANSCRSNETQSGLRSGRIFLDHIYRVARALDGFRAYGRRWLVPWTAYSVSPILSRLVPGRIAHFHGFNARLGECDLYTFANVFTDYPIAELSSALREVELVIDLGANVGSFLFLVQNLCERMGHQPRLVALEPATSNVEFLRKQPFAEQVEIYQAAAGPSDGTGRLVSGQNSVTDHVEFSRHAAGPLVPVLSLESLCRQRALVKMDIEGGEVEILARILPENVRHLILEWHGHGRPSDLLPGNWKRISADIHGASTWHFWR
ncbi:MAG TPA: FkbM family methyltransferase [Chthoniobacterales bacterium]|jgi:FkbM family methyltransferase